MLKLQLQLEVEGEHRMFVNVARKLFGDELTPNIEEWADAGIVDRGFWYTVGAQGVMDGA